LHGDVCGGFENCNSTNAITALIYQQCCRVAGMRWSGKAGLMIMNCTRIKINGCEAIRTRIDGFRETDGFTYGKRRWRQRNKDQLDCVWAVETGMGCWNRGKGMQ